MAARPSATSDAELCSAITAGGLARDKAIETIYQWQDMKTKVIHYVKQHGGQRDDGMDVFHEGIVALDRNIREGRYRAESGLPGYLYTICRYIWNNEWRRRLKVPTGEMMEHQVLPEEATPEAMFRSQEETNLLRKVLFLLDDSCRKILTYWKLSYSMAEIAVEMQLSSPEMAKKYRYRCMQKLMNQLEENPALYNALKHV